MKIVNKEKCVIVALIIACIAAVCLAPTARGATLDTRVINTMVSEAGEDKQQFLMRVATFLQGWTASEGSEACGLIAEYDEAWSVVVTTLDSQIQCDNNKMLVGWQNTGETIHSHPKLDAKNRVKLTDRTRVVAGGAYQNLTYFTSIPRQFSRGDYAAGPGYLVTDGTLFYQAGKGTRIVVGDVP